MNEAKNLACPFCGGQARVISRGYQDGGKWTDWVSVTCPATEGGCGASQAATTESQAWNKWNRRAGGRQPAMPGTAGTKHVGISDLLAGERVSEKDFVFLDHAYRPYRVRDVNGTLWLHYWHADNKWVTKRTVSDDEAMQWIESALPPAQAKLYEAGVPFLAS